MPSPVGHALAGAATGWAVQALSRHPDPARQIWREAAVFATLAVIPDVDLLVGPHRGPTHSLVAAVIAGLAAFAVTRRPRFAVAASLAYVTHVLLDWLGADSSPPLGLQALWPFSRAYVESGLHLFPAVSRQFGAPWFWSQNVRALCWEVGTLAPLALAAAALRRKRL